MALWPPLLAVAGPGDASGAHRHHNLHLVLARAGSIRVQVGDHVHDAAGVLTRADVEHAIDAAGREVVILFVEPESVPGASLLTRFTEPAALFDGDTRDALLAELPAKPGSADLDAWAHATLATLTDGAWTRPRMHPLVRRLLTELRDEPLEHEHTLEQLAERIGLSPSRLMHVFTESVGIPIRPYLRWLRTQRAATAIVTGVPLATAAIEAGFSDAAHMSRTFKQMFGLTPSALQRRSRDGR
jgi:AraC-like DNA-binding protein